MSETETALKPARGLDLFKLNAELLELMALREDMAEAGEDTTAADNQIAVYVQREIKSVDGIRAWFLHCKMMEEAATEESRRQHANAALWAGRRDRMLDFCQAFMESTGEKRLEGRTGRLLLKGNGGLAALTIDDPLLIPEECCDYVCTIPGKLWGGVPDRFKAQVKAERVVRNDRVREALKAGEVAGARLAERGKHIEVK